MPLSQNNDLSSELGTRHRAAIGMSENSDATHVIMKCNNKTVEIHVYKVAQTKYMWGKEHSTDLQYALRVKDIEQGEKYAAIGYYTKSGETILSTEIETVEVQ